MPNTPNARIITNSLVLYPGSFVLDFYFHMDYIC